MMHHAARWLQGLLRPRPVVETETAATATAPVTLRVPDETDRRLFADENHLFGDPFLMGTDRHGRAWCIAATTIDKRPHPRLQTLLTLVLYPVRPTARERSNFAPRLDAAYILSSAPEYGFIVERGPAVYISDLVVRRPTEDDDAQHYYGEGAGLGSLLLRAVVLWATQHGAVEVTGALSRVDASIPERSLRVQEFFRRQGFRVTLYDDARGDTIGRVTWTPRDGNDGLIATPRPS